MLMLQLLVTLLAWTAATISGFESDATTSLAAAATHTTAAAAPNAPASTGGSVPSSRSESMATSPVSGGGATPTAEAAFKGAGGVSGKVAFSQADSAAPAKIDVMLTYEGDVLSASDAAAYHVHQFAVGADGGCGPLDTGGHFDPTGRVAGSEGYPTAAGAALDLYEVGDLSGKFGKITETRWEASFLDTTLTLIGEDSVIGRSIVVHAPDGSRKACATILALSDGDAAPAAPGSTAAAATAEAANPAAPAPATTATAAAAATTASAAASVAAAAAAATAAGASAAATSDGYAGGGAVVSSDGKVGVPTKTAADLAATTTNVDVATAPSSTRVAAVPAQTTPAAGGEPAVSSSEVAPGPRVTSPVEATSSVAAAVTPAPSSTAAPAAGGAVASSSAAAPVDDDSSSGGGGDSDGGGGAGTGSGTGSGSHTGQGGGGAEHWDGDGETGYSDAGSVAVAVGVTVGILGFILVGAAIYAFVRRDDLPPVDATMHHHRPLNDEGDDDFFVGQLNNEPEAFELGTLSAPPANPNSGPSNGDHAKYSLDDEHDGAIQFSRSGRLLGPGGGYDFISDA